MNREPKKALSMPGNFPVSLDDEEGPEYWQNHLDSWHRSGLSQAAYCREHDLDYNRFRKWKVHLSTYPSAGTSIKLVEVKRDFTLNRNVGSYPPPPPSPSFGTGFNSSSDCGGGSYPGYAGLHRAGTGGSSGIRFWCGEFCIEVDVKFSSDTLRQLLQTLQGVYVKNEGDAADAGEE
jgi:hypothetical protein